LSGGAYPTEGGLPDASREDVASASPDGGVDASVDSGVDANTPFCTGKTAKVCLDWDTVFPLADLVPADANGSAGTDLNTSLSAPGSGRFKLAPNVAGNVYLRYDTQAPANDMSLTAALRIDQAGNSFDFSAFDVHSADGSYCALRGQFNPGGVAVREFCQAPDGSTTTLDQGDPLGPLPTVGPGPTWVLWSIHLDMAARTYDASMTTLTGQTIGRLSGHPLAAAFQGPVKFVAHLGFEAVPAHAAAMQLNMDNVLLNYQ
jgi:hypothetical protein